MTTLVIPASHEEIIFVCVGNSSYSPSPEELAEIRDWVTDHRDTWPKCFPDLNNIFHQPMELKVFPAENPNHKYVFVLESEYSPCEADIKAWTKVLTAPRTEKFTVFVIADYFDSIKRINKNLLPFL